MTDSSAFTPGHTSPGGPEAVWDLPAAQVRKASVSAMDNNAYLIVDSASGDHLLIDAADDPPRLHRMLEAAPGRLVGIVTTHRHADHHGALADLVATTGAPALAGADDADHLPVAVQRRLRHGETVRVGDLQLDVIALRGHTPGSIALALAGTTAPSLIFSGDSLFPGGVGRTTSAADFDQLLADVRARVFQVYPDTAVVLPGHGDNTTVGAERGSLAQWAERRW